VDEVVEPSEEVRNEESGFEERGGGKIMMLYVRNCDVDFMRRGD
jgi:hypothetical protein